ncbi:trehalose-phosphatase, partial [candidate division KSB1 bacterium]|nr:trehalose-phosphatase [candidate division KSB1 bacterium]
MSRPLFENLAEITERLASAANVLLFLDFDGTLTPIVEHPDMAHLPPAMYKTLGRLARRDDLIIAIISGRSRVDVQARIGIESLIYAGNHGMEIVGPGFHFVEPTADAGQKEMHLLAQQLIARLRHIVGAIVEYKGLTTSIHFRRTTVATRNELAQIVQTAVARNEHLFKLTKGKMVYEIRPRVDWHKGTAARWILDNLAKNNTLTICLGDDIT